MVCAYFRIAIDLEVDGRHHASRHLRGPPDDPHGLLHSHVKAGAVTAPPVLGMGPNATFGPFTGRQLQTLIWTRQLPRGHLRVERERPQARQVPCPYTIPTL